MLTHTLFNILFINYYKQLLIHLQSIINQTSSLYQVSEQKMYFVNKLKFCFNTIVMYTNPLKRQNRSFTHLNGGYENTASPRPSHSRSPFHFPKTNSNLLNKSNLSVHSEHIWNMLQDVELFPIEFGQTLKNEQRNISQFKIRIDREKSRMNSDVDSFKKEVVHHIDDFRLSISAELDAIYKQYMERYARFKGDLIELKRTREAIEREVEEKARRQSSQKINNLSSSNINTIKSMENGYNDLKKYHMINYISELQKNKIGPIEDELNQLIVLTEYQNGFYLHQQLTQMLQKFKEDFKAQLRALHHNKTQFLREIQSLFMKDISSDTTSFRHQEELHSQKQRQSPLKEPGFSRQGGFQRQGRYQSQEGYEKMFSNPIQRNDMKGYQREINRDNNTGSSRAVDPRSKTRGKLYPNRNSQLKNHSISISAAQQTAVYDWLEELKLTPSYTLKPTATANTKIDFTLKPQISDIILCAIVINIDQMAIGSKDGLLSIYNISNSQRVQTLKGHNSPICCLALIKSEGAQYLASGSDYGCNCIMIWQVGSWSLRQKLEGHKAAVTAIADLMDGENIVSGSYDKRINIYNMKSGRISYNLPSNKSPVTGIIINNSGMKMISCGLDNSLNIWQIQRSAHKIVTTLFLQKVITNNAMVCSLVGSLMREDVVYIGSKDGKIKIINIERGETEKTIPCCNNAVIEMVVVERQTHPNYPLIVVWPCKQQCIKIINTETSKINSIEIKGFIQFGCGIGPKSLLLNNGQLAMLSQSQFKKQVTFYKVQDTLK